MMSNPQMRAMIDQNPQLAHILSNPDMMRQSMQIAANPEMMQEMMRNNDRAMSNLETHPEGFNALRRAYEDVQAPLMDMAQGGFMGGDANADAAGPAGGAGAGVGANAGAAGAANPF